MPTAVSSGSYLAAVEALSAEDIQIQALLHSFDYTASERFFPEGG